MVECVLCVHEWLSIAGESWTAVDTVSNVCVETESGGSSNAKWSSSKIGAHGWGNLVWKTRFCAGTITVGVKVEATKSTSGFMSASSAGWIPIMEWFGSVLPKLPSLWRSCLLVASNCARVEWHNCSEPTSSCDSASSLRFSLSWINPLFVPLIWRALCFSGAIQSFVFSK